MEYILVCSEHSSLLLELKQTFISFYYSHILNYKSFEPIFELFDRSFSISTPFPFSSFEWIFVDVDGVVVGVMELDPNVAVEPLVDVDEVLVVAGEQRLESSSSVVKAF